MLPLVTMPVRELEDAIAAIDPDRPDVARAASLADALADHPAVGALARTIARTLRACETGEVQAHHAQWRLASAALTLRLELERAQPSALALDGARYDLETLFPRLPDQPQPPTAEDLDLIPPTDLTRRR